MMKKKLLFESPWMTANEVIRDIENKATKVVEINIDGVIGDRWDEEEAKAILTKETMRKELKALAELKAEKIIVNINSPGGSVAHGISIHDLLAQHQAEIVTRVTGMTASIATVIVQAGDTREISDNGLLLAHHAMYGIMGGFNQLQLKELIDDLAVFDNKIINIFEKRGVEKDPLLEVMDAQTGYGRWMNAQEAKEIGFVDSIFEPMKAVAMVDPDTLKALHLPEIPSNFINMETKKKDETTDDSNKTLLDQIKDLISKVIPAKDDKGEEKAPEIPTDLADQLKGFEERLTGLEQTNTDLTSQVETLTADLKTRTEELDASRITVKELETKLTQGKAGSTKIPGVDGQEDKDDLKVGEESKSLENDLASLRSQMAVVHP